MKIWMYEKTGGPDVLELRTVDTPSPRPGELLIRVETVGINRLDIIMRRGEFPLPHVAPFPRSVGMEFCGTVADIGAGVDREKFMDKRFVGSAEWCGECNACLRGEDTQCPDRKRLGVETHGCYAEYVTIRSFCAYPVPDGLDARQAVALRTAFGTGWHLLFGRGNVRNGDTILVQSASSSIASASIILAKMAGAKVVALTSSPEKIRKVEKLGADVTLSYLKSGWQSEAKKAIGGKPFDWVLSVTGGGLFLECLELLRFGGSILFPGAHVGPSIMVPLTRLFAFERSMIGVNGPNYLDVKRVYELAMEGKIRPIIDRIFPFDEAPAAQAHIDAEEKCGKVLLQL